MKFKWINIKTGKNGFIHAENKESAKKQMGENGIRSEHCFVEESYMTLIDKGE